MMRSGDLTTGSGSTMPQDSLPSLAERVLQPTCRACGHPLRRLRDDSQCPTCGKWQPNGFLGVCATPLSVMLWREPLQRAEGATLDAQLAAVRSVLGRVEARPWTKAFFAGVRRRAVGEVQRLTCALDARRELESLRNDLARGAIRPLRRSTVASLPLRPAERVILHAPAALWELQVQRHAITAGVRGSHAGGGIGLSFRSLSLGVGGGSFGATVTGVVEKIAEFAPADVGQLYITTNRVLYVGNRRSQEVELEAVLSVAISVDGLMVKWTGNQTGQQFRMTDGDLVGECLAALIHHLRRPPEVGTYSPPHTPTTDTDVASRQERECPHCAERILARAKLCKHCGSTVAPLAAGGTA